MRALKIKRLALIESLEASGQLRPATIINFNPIELIVNNYMINFSVPAASARIAKTIKLSFKKRDFVGSALVIRNLITYPMLRNVTGEFSDPKSEYDMRACLPIEIADLFRQTYNDMGSNHVGGVLVFEGDTHALHPKHGGKLRIPKFKRLADNTLSYFTEEVGLEETLGEQLERQKTHFTNRMARSQAMFNDPELRKNILDTDRTWAQWGLNMGYIQTAPEWLYSTDEPEDQCEQCGTPKKRGTAYFCVCGAPYNPFAAYMAGRLDIANVHMNRLSEKEWAEVRDEEKKRKKLRGEEEKKKKPEAAQQAPAGQE